MSVNVMAARAIASRVEMSVGDRRALLEILGLVDSGGCEILPDGFRVVELPTLMNQGGKGVKNPDGERVRPRRGSAPAGLRGSPVAPRDTGAGPAGHGR